MNRIYVWIYFNIVEKNNKYYKIDIDHSKNILVMSPHVDDETIGIGGTLVKYSKISKNMTLVYLTDGSGSTSNKSKEEVIEERRQEGIKVKDSYGFKNICFLDQIDGSLNCNDKKLIDKIKNIIEVEKPDVIFSPFLIDGNNDHMETTKALSKALSLTDIEPKNIYLYQVNNIIHPKLVNAISILDRETYEEKRDKYTIFKSQWAMGFSIYDLICKGRGLKYKEYGVEPFVDVNTRQLRHGIKVLENNSFKPHDFKQISSEFTFLPGVIKSYQKKKKYNSLIRELLEK